MWGACPRSSYLCIVHYNARSLYPKFDELRAICDMEKPNVVCITKTWFCDDIVEAECTIHGYTSVRCDRNRHGGGVALFISNKLEFNTIMAGPYENLNFYWFPYKMQTIRCTLDCGTVHLLISNHWMFFYTLFWKVWMSDFHIVLYFWEILMLTFIIISIHFFTEFCIVLY